MIRQVAVVVGMCVGLASGQTLPYAGSVAHAGDAFWVENTNTLTFPYVPGSALRATSTGVAVGVQVSSNSNYGVFVTSNSPFAAIYGTNSQSGSGVWGAYFGGPNGVQAASNQGKDGLNATSGCGTAAHPPCWFATDPTGFSSVRSSASYSFGRGYANGVYARSECGQSLKVFGQSGGSSCVSGYEPIVWVQAATSAPWAPAMIVSGKTQNTYGIQLTNNGGGALYVSSSNNPSGPTMYVSGDTYISGTLTATIKNFRIDHPSDPTNYYLEHSVIESDGYKTAYDGTIVLNEAGEGLVALPRYVEQIAGDFRYQLTSIGGFSPVYIASEVRDGSFRIAGGKAGLKVSWQLVGIRKDLGALAAPLVVERPKQGLARGRYIRPELFGAASSLAEGLPPERTSQTTKQEVSSDSQPSPLEWERSRIQK